MPTLQGNHRGLPLQNVPMKNKYLKGISGNVFLLGIVSFLNDLSSEMIMPILPMFVTALGGAGLTVGLVGGFRDSISSILKVFCGYWSDRTGKRKLFVSSGYLTSSLFKLFLAFSKTWQHILIFLLVWKEWVKASGPPQGIQLLQSLWQKSGVKDLEFTEPSILPGRFWARLLFFFYSGFSALVLG